jgi:hypothetical protein
LACNGYTEDNDAFWFKWHHKTPGLAK